MSTMQHMEILAMSCGRTTVTDIKHNGGRRKGTVGFGYGSQSNPVSPRGLGMLARRLGKEVTVLNIALMDHDPGDESGGFVEETDDGLRLLEMVSRVLHEYVARELAARRIAPIEVAEVDE